MSLSGSRYIPQTSREHARIQYSLLLLLLPLCICQFCPAEDVIVYSCYQNFNSRIYILGMDGSVYDWFQYDMYRICDLENVNGDVHLAEAFAPRSYRIDLQTGELDLIIDDWFLYYFYDLAFDGNYLYVTEWDMNRYLPDGTGGSSTSFDHDVYGSTFLDDRLWTINEDSLIRCWDISSWPVMVEDSARSFSPPTGSCRGLSHDGEFFWTAESIESQLGYIYCFDSEGTVVTEIVEPSFQGWSACITSGYQSDIESGTWGSIKTLF